MKNVYMEHRNFHTKSCVFTAPDAILGKALPIGQKDSVSCPAVILSFHACLEALSAHKECFSVVYSLSGTIIIIIAIIVVVVVVIVVIVVIIIIIIIIKTNMSQLGLHQDPGKTRVIRRVLVSITVCRHPHPLSQPQLYRHTAAARGRQGAIENGVVSAVLRDAGCDKAVILSTPHSGGEDVGSRYSRREHARCVVIATTFVHLYIVENNWFAELCLRFVDASGTKHHRPARLF